MKVLFLTLYPEQIASSRYRVYQYIPYLEKEGFKCFVMPAISQRGFLRFHSSKNFWGKISYQALEFFNRLISILKSKDYDIVFIQKGLLSLRLKGLVNILLKFAKNIIFDFDDFVNLWPPQQIPKFLSFLEDKNQIFCLIKYAKHIVAGNRFLRDYALVYNNNVTIIPTSIDTERFFAGNKKNESDKVIIGWIGSTNTEIYLQIVKEPLKELLRRYKITFKVISDRPPFFEGVPLEFKKWNYEQEVEDLQSIDIGIMPLPYNEWTRGKCGLKALQYMAIGIPAVCSPVGVNSQIIQDGHNGFLAYREKEWIDKLSLLIENPDLRKKIGQVARITVEEKYSLKVNAPKLKKTLEEVQLE